MSIPRLTVMLAIAPLMALLIWWSASFAGHQHPQRPEQVVIIGVESGSWNFLRKGIKNGRFPHLETLYRQGVWGQVNPSSRTDRDVQQWHSIVTGHLPKTHGIEALFQPPLKDRKLTTSNFRRSKALWNLAGEHGKTVGVVGSWVTWPAEKVNGFMIGTFQGLKIWPPDEPHIWSDRPLYGQPTIQGTIFANPKLNQTYPESMYREVEPFIERGELQARKQVHEWLSLPDSYDGKEEWIEAIKWVLASDEIYSSAAVHLFRKYAPELLILYFRGLDAVGHRILPRNDRRALDPNPYVLYYKLLDQRVGEMLAVQNRSTLVIVLSAHGVDTYGLHHRPVPGIFLAHGPGVRAGWNGTSIDLLDIAPTLLYLLDIPISKELPGHINNRIIDPDLLKAYPPAYIQSYGDNPSYRPDVLDTTAFDKEISKRISKLGAGQN